MDRSETVFSGFGIGRSNQWMLSPGCFAPEEFALQNRYFRPDKLIDNVELEKVENLKKALGAGTYDVHAEQVAGKLIDYMLQSSNRPSLLDADSFAAISVDASPARRQYKSKAAPPISVNNLKPTG
jgi:hypothetical protein